MAHFEMKMGWIHTSVRAYRSDLLAALDGLAILHENFIQVSVERIDEFNRAAGWVTIGMADKHHISPTGFHIMSESDDAIGDGVNRVAEVGVAAAASVPVLTIVRGRAQAQATGFVIVFRIGLADRVVEAIGDVHLGSGERGGRGKNGEEENEEKTDPCRSKHPTMQILVISEESSHLRLVEPVKASSGKRKEKRRTFVGCAVLTFR